MTTARLQGSTIGAPAVLPNAPTNLTVTVTGSTVTLQWSASPGAVSYIVEAGSASGLANLANFDTGTASTTLTALNVPPATYYIRVRARNDAGTTAPSNEALAIVQGSPPCGLTNAPTALTAAVTGNSITLSWLAPSGGCAPTSYVIQAGSAPGLSDLANFSTGSAATSFSAGGIGAGTYFVRVRAATGAGASGSSNEVSFTIGGCLVVAAPTGLTSSVIGSTVTLNWNSGSGACAPTSYLIQAGSAPGSSDLANVSTGNAATAFTATGVGAGTYYIRIVGRVGTLSSSPSNEITVVVSGGGGCGYAFSPTQDSAVSSGGGSGTTSLTASCAWTLSIDVPWILVTSAMTGTSSGSVIYSVTANTTGTARTGHIRAQGAGAAATFTVTQTGGTCSYAFSPTSQNAPVGGNSYSAAIFASCAWTASSDAQWLVIFSGAAGSGNGVVSFAVSPNSDPSGPRAGHITVTGAGGTATFTVNQDAPILCTYALTNPIDGSAQQSAPPAGGSFNAGLTASPAGCTWALNVDQSAPPNMLSISSPPTGTGNTNWGFAVTPLPGGTSSRTGTITVRTTATGRVGSATYTVKQQ